MLKKLTFLFVFSSNFLLADSLVFYEPSLVGPACVDAAWVLSPSSNSLSILLNQFNLVGNQYQTCQILIPISIEGPISETNPKVIQTDYRGFYDLPEETMLSHQVSYQLNQNQEFVKVNFAHGPDTNTYTYSHQPSITCNGTQILKLWVQSALLGNPNASYSLDTIDLGTAVTPDFALQLCSSAASSTVFSPMLALVTTLFLWTLNSN